MQRGHRRLLTRPRAVVWGGKAVLFGLAALAVLESSSSAAWPAREAKHQLVVTMTVANLPNPTEPIEVRFLRPRHVQPCSYKGSYSGGNSSTKTCKRFFAGPKVVLEPKYIWGVEFQGWSVPACKHERQRQNSHVPDETCRVTLVASRTQVKVTFAARGQ
jgi:hypothetical protein